MKKRGFVHFFFILATIFSLSAWSPGLAQQKTADTIYFGGDIITIHDRQPSAQGVAVKDGRVLAVGKRGDILKYKGRSTRVVDLKNRTLMPGFIDAHSHVVQNAFKVYAAVLDPPPVGTIRSIADLKVALGVWRDSHDAGVSPWIVGMGYDDALLEEKRHPTRFDLDEIVQERPILILHVSGHIAVVNSKALELAGIDRDTKDLAGGVIRKMPESMEPNGVLEEHAIGLIAKVFPLMRITAENPMAQEHMRKSLHQYGSFGITTATECFAGLRAVEILARMAGTAKLPLDVVAWPAWMTPEDRLGELISQHGAYENHFRVGGVKIILDGSIQGYTAYLSLPYHIPPESSSGIYTECAEPESSRIPAEKPSMYKEYRGYPAMPDEEVNRELAMFLKNGWDVQAHCNGDAAADQLLKAVEEARKIYPEAKSRVFMIHAQTLREDQLERLQGLGITPSFFPGHTYSWGDRHREIFLGPERAARIDPTKSAADRKMRFTLHHDAPVVPANMLMVIWSAVNRETRNGEILGPEQRVSVMDALRGVTINAAWQHREETLKGSIEPGKLADFVILSANPLKVDPLKIKDIKVLETIKEGQSVFRRGKGASR